MRVSSLLAIIAVLVPPVVLAPPCQAARPARHFPQTPSGDTFPNKSIIIYVADFDLQATRDSGSSGSAANRKAASNVTSSVTPNVTANLTAAASPSPATATATATTPLAPQGSAPSATVAKNEGADSVATADAQKSQSPKSDPARGETPNADAQKSEAPKTDSSTDDSPRAQAAKLVDLTPTTLVKVLEQQGYSVRRLRGGASPPDSGVIIRGVFAQVDANFGIRRAVIGGLATDTKMLLFVGIGNLSRPEQSVYAVISPQPADNIGPLISVSAYAPVGRYELDRDPSEELLRRAATNIASDLTRLLNANPLALQQ
jgi:Domain of unknown function (DUF4410)